MINKDNNYKPNSRLSANREGDRTEVADKKIEKIVTGVAKKKKKNGFLTMFLADEAMDLKNYVVFEVLIPAVKTAVSDIVTNGIDMMLYGESSHTKKSSRSSKISYSGYYDKGSRGRDWDRDKERTKPGGYNYDDVILESKGEVLDVLNRLDELIEVYGMASVADLYDLVGISGQYTDNKYGWTDLRSATSARVRDGYLLKMPRAIPLN